MQEVKYAMGHLVKLADYNFTPRLTGLCKTIQHEDKVSSAGQRNVLISQQRDLLEGFRLNQKYPLGNLITTPIGNSIDRETKKAVVRIPRLIRGINMLLPWKFPVYRFVIVLGTAADAIYTNYPNNVSRYETPGDIQSSRNDLETAWFINGAPFAPQDFEIALQPEAALRDDQTLLLSIAIEMGAPEASGEIQAVRYAGSAMILAAG